MAQDQKQEAIIEAAIRRFAHFGVAKTTMSEIAADLNLSKASLYYYFPDKLNLYAAVIKTITHLGEHAGDPELDKEKDPFKAIQYFLEKRTDFIIKYHNILEFLKTFHPSKVPPELQPIFTQLKKREQQRLTRIIEKGVESGIFKIRDAKKTAELFFDFLDGFRIACLLNNNNFFPDKKQFLSILKKETEFAAVFFNGLTVKSPL
ncbi:MAG TPA: TetR/AcrR family transcriptional regulator [Chitinophagaceae bacterium]|nr:TetR/AcrR family transcriptional regulator [Chitinophagaceae bacterium]